MSENAEKIIICFDATELDNFDMCPMRWHMFHHRRVIPKHTESHFELGSLLHYFLEKYYEFKRDGRLIDQSLIEEIIEKGRIKSLDFDLSVEEVAQTVFQFREYVAYYQDENIIPIAVEQPFMVQIYEDDKIIVIITGKPDLVFRYGSYSSGNCVMDHKRMSRQTNYSPLRNQFLLYATAMDTDTVIVNKVGFQKTLPRKDRFQRTPLVYSKEIKEEWKQETIQIAKEMLIHHQLEYYPRRRTSCEKWNGCYLQRYCATKPNAREFLIGTEYLIAPEGWDVSKKLEEGK